MRNGCSDHLEPQAGEPWRRETDAGALHTLSMRRCAMAGRKSSAPPFLPCSIDMKRARMTCARASQTNWGVGGSSPHERDPRLHWPAHACAYEPRAAGRALIWAQRPKEGRSWAEQPLITQKSVANFAKIAPDRSRAFLGARGACRSSTRRRLCAIMRVWQESVTLQQQLAEACTAGLALGISEDGVLTGG